MAKKFDLIQRPLNKEELAILRRLQKKIGGEATPALLEFILENRYPPANAERVRKKICQKTARSVNIKNIAGSLNQLLKRDQDAMRDSLALRVRITCDESGIRKVFMVRQRGEAPPPESPKITEPSEEEARTLKDCEDGLLRQIDRTPEVERIIQKYWRPVYKASHPKPQ